MSNAYMLLIADTYKEYYVSVQIRKFRYYGLIYN